MRTYIVTGASGFIGKALTQYLLQENHRVVAIVRDAAKSVEPQENLQVIEADFERYDRLSEKLPPADVFFHFAWGGVWGNATTDYGLQLDNAKAACAAMEQAIKSGCKKFVLASTIAEAEVMEHIDKNICKPRANCMYAAAKLCAEMMCKTMAAQNNMEFNAGLLANVFGPGDYSRRSSNIIVNHFNHHVAPKLVKGEGLNDWLYIKDAVRLIAAMGNGGVPMKTYYIGHTDLKPLRKIIEEVRDVLAPEVALKFGEMPDSFLTNYDYVSTKDLYMDTGCRAEYPFAQAVRETAEWVKSLRMEI